MNRKVSTIVITCLLSVLGLLTFISTTTAAIPEAVRSGALFPNLLSNPDFEGGCSHPASRTLHYDPSGGPYPIAYNEVCVPDGYSVYWFEGFPCASHPPQNQGRPEVTLIDNIISDPLRVYSGTQALKMFTFFQCHRMGFFQTVSVTPGIDYSLVGYAHAWHSSCSSRPHDPPLSSDCSTPLPDSWDHLKIGIDPTGGTDPTSPSVIWSNNYEQYGVYGSPLEISSIEALSSTITIFAESECNYPLKHNDAYWDTLSLTRDPWYLFFSFISKEWQQ